MGRRIVWSAVAAVVLGAAALAVSLFTDMTSTVIALGFGGVTAALLANRER